MQINVISVLKFQHLDRSVSADVDRGWLKAKFGNKTNKMPLEIQGGSIEMLDRPTQNNPLVGSAHPTKLILRIVISAEMFHHLDRSVSAKLP
jgi:hypothetical protein